MFNTTAGQQGQIARPLYRRSHLTLSLRGNAGHPAGNQFPAVIDKLLQKRNILVINIITLLQLIPY